jgi:ABC-type Fe3+/spermidine/putrescine transport system ATPase subunit
MSDRIAVMNEGRFEQIGTPRELYERPINSFIADFVGETNFLEGKVLDREGDISIFLTTFGNKLKVQLPADTPTGNKLTIAVRPEKLFITKKEQPILPTLSGVVKEIVYLGEITKYIVDISESKQLIVKQMNRYGVVDYQKGAEVKIAFNPQDAKKVLSN